MSVVRPVLVTVLAGAGVAGCAWAVGMPLHPVLGPLLVAVVALTLVLLRRLPPVAPLPWDRPGDHRQTLTADRRLSALRWAVPGLRGGNTWERTIGPLLLASVEHRLREHHGTDPHEQPEQARALLSPELRHLVDDPRTAPTSAAALRALITRIEEL